MTSSSTGVSLGRSSKETNQRALVCQADQSRRERRAKGILPSLLSSPLQGSFDGGSFFSASAPRLASTLSTSPLLLLFKLLIQVLCQVF